MRIRTALLTCASIVVPALATAQQAPLKMEEPIVHFGLVDRHADGSPVGSAVQTAEEPDSYKTGIVYMLPCQGLGAAQSGLPVSSAATDVWQISTRVLALGNDEATAQVTWQVIRRNGQDVQTTPQSTTLTLERGQRLTLEEIAVPARGTCAARAVTLDAFFASRHELRDEALERMRTQGASSASGAAPAGSTRAFAARGNGVTTMRVAPANAPAPTTLHADVWLIRTGAGSPVETLHTTTPVLRLPLRFAFAPMTIDVPSGTATVQVEGTVEVGQTADGEEQFFFSAGRRVGFVSRQQPARDNAPVSETSTRTAVPVPGPDDVLSFDLPPVQLPGGNTLPDRFSIRVRLTPRAMQPVAR